MDDMLEVEGNLNFDDVLDSKSKSSGSSSSGCTSTAARIWTSSLDFLTTEHNEFAKNDMTSLSWPNGQSFDLHENLLRLGRSGPASGLQARMGPSPAKKRIDMSVSKVVDVDYDSAISYVPQGLEVPQATSELAIDGLKLSSSDAPQNSTSESSTSESSMACEELFHERAPRRATPRRRMSEGSTCKGVSWGQTKYYEKISDLMSPVSLPHSKDLFSSPYGSPRSSELDTTYVKKVASKLKAGSTVMM